MKTKTYSDGNSAVEKQKKRTEELYNKVMSEMFDKTDNKEVETIRNLCEKHSELIDDFKVVTEMNTVASERFDEVLDKFPTTKEIDSVISNLDIIYDHEEEILARKLKLLSFRKICVHLDKHTDNIRPKSYSESIETKEINTLFNQSEEGDNLNNNEFDPIAQKLKEDKRND